MGKHVANVHTYDGWDTDVYAWQGWCTCGWWGPYVEDAAPAGHRPSYYDFLIERYGREQLQVFEKKLVGTRLQALKFSLLHEGYDPQELEPAEAAFQEAKSKFQAALASEGRPDYYKAWYAFTDALKPYNEARDRWEAWQVEVPVMPEANPEAQAAFAHARKLLEDWDYNLGVEEFQRRFEEEEAGK